MTENHTSLPYAPATIRLMQGIMYVEDKQTWDIVVNYQAEIKKYLQVIGLEVYVDEAEGYAFVKQKEPAEGEESLPVLSGRRRTQLCHAAPRV